MSATRWGTFEALAETTDAAGGRTTTVAELARRLDAEETAVAEQLRALAACDLAVREAGGDFRVTVTGEELRALDPDGEAIVDPRPSTES